MHAASIYICAEWKIKKLIAKLILQAAVGQKSDLKSDQGQPKHLVKYKGKGRFFLGIQNNLRVQIMKTTKQKIANNVMNNTEIIQKFSSQVMLYKKRMEDTNKTVLKLLIPISSLWYWRVLDAQLPHKYEYIITPLS